MAQQFLAEIKEEAQRPPLQDGAAGAIQRQLESRYRLTKITPDGTDVAAVGAIADDEEGPAGAGQGRSAGPATRKSNMVIERLPERIDNTGANSAAVLSALTAVVSGSGNRGQPEPKLQEG